MRVAINMTGIDNLLTNVQRLNDNTSSEIVPDAIRKGMRVVGQRIRQRTPLQTGRALKLARNAKRPRLRYSLIEEYRGYPQTGDIKTTHVGIVGAPAKQQPHQWIVEDGTVPRYTNQKRVRTGRTLVGSLTKQRSYRRKDGTVSVRRYEKKQWDYRHETRIKKKGKPQHYRGRMPAFHMFRRGASETGQQVAAVMAAALRRGISAVEIVL